MPASEFQAQRLCEAVFSQLIKSNTRAPFKSLLDSVSTLTEAPGSSPPRSKRARLAQTVAAVCNTSGVGGVPRQPSRATARVVRSAEGSLDLVARVGEASRAKLCEVVDPKVLTALAGAYLSAQSAREELRGWRDGFAVLADDESTTGACIRLQHVATGSEVTFEWVGKSSISLQFASRLPQVLVQSGRCALRCRVLWGTGDSTADVLRRVEQVLAQFCVIRAACVGNTLDEVPMTVECGPGAVLDWIHLRCHAQIGVWVPALRLKVSLEQDGQIEHELESDECGVRNCVVSALQARMRGVLISSVSSGIACWLQAIKAELQG